MIITDAHVSYNGAFHDVDVEYDESKIINIGENLAKNANEDEIIDAKGKIALHRSWKVLKNYHVLKTIIKGKVVYQAD